MNGHWVIAIYRKVKAPDRPRPVEYFNGMENVFRHESAIRFVDEVSADAMIDVLARTTWFAGAELVSEKKELH